MVREGAVGWRAFLQSTFAVPFSQKGNTMLDLKYPDWQKQFHAAQLETDERKLLIKASEAESAIALRLQAIAGNSDHHEERLAIADAVSKLRTWQTQKLKFPDSTEV
jgi:hypothetical protein